jgi:hypothetical protein
LDESVAQLRCYRFRKVQYLKQQRVGNAHFQFIVNTQVMNNCFAVFGNGSSLILQLDLPTLTIKSAQTLNANHCLFPYDVDRVKLLKLPEAV